MRRFLALLFFSLAVAQGETASVRIGGRTVRIPTPVGFVRYDGKSQKVDALQASFIPASNRVVAAYGEPADLEKVIGDQFPALSRSFSAQENWQYESADVSAEEFTAVKASLREQMDTLKSAAAAASTDVEKSASSALSSKLDANLNVKISEVTPLGTFAETPDTICFSMLVKSRLAGGPLADPIDPHTAVAGCVALVRDRLLYLYANSSYLGKPDADWARAQIVLWRDAVLAANAPGATEETDLPPEPMADDTLPWWRQKRSAAIVVAGLIAAWWLLRRKPFHLPK